MRLHGVYDGQVYGTDYRTVLIERPGAGYAPVGSLPVPTSGLAALRYRLLTGRRWKAALERLVGSFPSVTLHRFTDVDLLATAGPWLFTSHDGGRDWRLRHRLPASSGPMGVLPPAVCYHDGTVYLGEYPLGPRSTPRILRSDDLGRSWSTELDLDGVRHVHAVQVDPFTGDRWVTTGDADEECQIARLRDGGLDVVGAGSQQWRAVELAFTPTAILWGVDCRYAESNPVYKLDRDDLAAARPDPTPVHRLADSVYYAATLPLGGDHWVAFSTAAEPMADSTAPTAHRNGSGAVSVVAASAATGFTEWHEVARYARQSRPVDWWNPGDRLPIAAAYAFLDADPARGVFINPLNTDRDDGAIRLVPKSVFRRLGGYR